jgi:hypothetical protein
MDCFMVNGAGIMFTDLQRRRGLLSQTLSTLVTVKELFVMIRPRTDEALEGIGISGGGGTVDRLRLGRLMTQDNRIDGPSLQRQSSHPSMHNRGHTTLGLYGRSIWLSKEGGEDRRLISVRTEENSG